jgi:hypothetical protein
MQPDLEQEGDLGRLLRELPEEAARPYTFGEFQRRAEQRMRAGHSRTGGQAVAATAVVAVGVIAFSIFLHAPASLAPPEVVTQRPPAGAAQAPPVTSPLQRSENLEHWLAKLPNDPAVVRVGSRAAVNGLEDRIAQVDDLLSAARAQDSPQQLMLLQQERTRLVGALVQVRYAETLADNSL